MLGIPYRANENLKQVVEKISREVQVDVSNEKFSVFRIGKREENKASPIKIKFENEEIKNKILKSPRKIHLTTQILGYKVTGKVFINQDLTKRNLELFKKCNTYKKENEFKYLWIKDGNIFLREGDNTKILLIEREDQLESN